MNPEKQPAFRYIMYARKSSEYEDSQIQSIQRQIDDLSQLVSRERLAVIREPLCESRSAFHPGRKEFEKLVQLTMEGRVNAWLCWHPNRLSRNPVDTGTIVYLMDQGKLHHVRTRERTYYNTSGDKFHLQMDLGISKKDSDEKSALILSGIRRRHRRGYPSGLPVIGYALRGQGRLGHSFWVADPARFNLVRQVFRRYLDGKDSLSTICAFAAKIGLATVPRRGSGGLALRNAAMRHVLLSPVYAGFFIGTDGERYALDETLPRIITEDEHSRVKEILSARNTSSRYSRQPLPAAYRGLILDPSGRPLVFERRLQLICDCKSKFTYLNRDRCPGCRKRLSELERPRYLSWSYYFCHRQRRNKGVTARVIREDRIDDFVVENIARKIKISRHLRDWAVANLRELGDKAIAEDPAITELEDFKALYAGKRKRLRDLYTSGQISEEEFAADCADLEKIFAEKEEKAGPKDHCSADIEKILDLAVELENVIRFGDATSKYQALKELCSSLIWDGEILSICNKKEVNILSETLESARKENPQFEPENCVDIACRNRKLGTVRTILYRGLYRLRT